MKVVLLYWSKEGISGTERYATSLICHMKSLSRKLGITLESLPIRKMEKSLFGRPIGGFISLLIKVSVARPQGNIVHSLSPEVICPMTNIVTVHDVFPIKYPGIYSTNPLLRKVNEIIFNRIPKIPHLVAVSETTKRDLKEIMNIEEERIRVIYEGVDFSTFFPENVPPRGLDAEKKSILLVGDLNPRKKYEVVFKAAPHLEDWTIYHIGSRNAWSNRWIELEKFAKKFPDRIKLIGPVSDEELRRWLSNVDFFVFPSMDEGFGLPALEAMACGTNVLLSDIPVFREIIGEMAAGYFSLDPESFLKALENAKPKKKEELVNYARKFSWEKAARETLEYYLEISRSP